MESFPFAHIFSNAVSFFLSSSSPADSLLLVHASGSFSYFISSLPPIGMGMGDQSEAGRKKKDEES
jgi:hypothetical protein